MKTIKKQKKILEVGKFSLQKEIEVSISTKKGGRPGLTDEQKNQILDLASQNLSIRAIADQLKISKSAVGRTIQSSEKK